MFPVVYSYCVCHCPLIIGCLYMGRCYPTMQQWHSHNISSCFSNSFTLLSHQAMLFLPSCFFSLSIFHTHTQPKRLPSSMLWLQTLCTEGLKRGSKLENNHMLSWATPPLPVKQFPREPFKNLSTKTGSHPRSVIHPALTLTGSNTRGACLWGTIGREHGKNVWWLSGGDPGDPHLRWSAETG